MYNGAVHRTLQNFDIIGCGGYAHAMFIYGLQTLSIAKFKLKGFKSVGR